MCCVKFRMWCLGHGWHHVSDGGQPVFITAVAALAIATVGFMTAASIMTL